MLLAVVIAGMLLGVLAALSQGAIKLFVPQHTGVAVDRWFATAFRNFMRGVVIFWIGLIIFMVLMVSGNWGIFD